MKKERFREFIFVHKEYKRNWREKCQNGWMDGQKYESQKDINHKSKKGTDKSRYHQNFFIVAIIEYFSSFVAL